MKIANKQNLVKFIIVGTENSNINTDFDQPESDSLCITFMKKRKTEKMWSRSLIRLSVCLTICSFFNSLIPFCSLCSLLNRLLLIL